SPRACSHRTVPTRTAARSHSKLTRNISPRFDSHFTTCWQSSKQPGHAKDMSSAAAESRTEQFSLPLPRSLDTRIYVHLTVRHRTLVLFLTTATADELASPTPMGSFVYALPDVSFFSL